MKRICVFCGANTGTAPVFRGAAIALAEAIVRRGLGVVYGGGAVGLMGELADAARAAGGEVIGVIPRHLVDREIGHRGLDDLRVVGSMHERKALMSELADGFAALPGGWGTLEELVEVVTWAQLGLHGKPVGILNVTGYFDPLLAFRERAIAAGFVRADHSDLLLVAEDPDELLDRFEAHVPPPPRYAGEPPRP
ncbi:MAG TPA: TIGR00730 family Rossman fold protein [Gaiellaceae bacterium]|nr:TIGR00730 family Rossman fold protein [Gaiellaceae bacterium]